MKLLVIGNITIDKIYNLKEFPKKGETLLANNKTINLGGKGLNQAIVAARSGLLNVQFLSIIGTQIKKEKQMIINYLKENRISSVILERKNYNDESIIFTNNAGENIIVSTDLLAKSLKPQEVDKYIKSLNSNDGILLQGNLSRKTTRYCIEEASNQGAKIMINLAPIVYRLRDLWDKIEYLIVNEEEVKFLTEKDCLNEAIKYIKKSNLKNVLITIGKKGTIIIKEDRSIAKIAASKVEVLDTTGAGDTFTGIFCAGVMKELDIEKAAKWATKAAGITVSRKGTSNAFPDQNEIKKLRGEK